MNKQYKIVAVLILALSTFNAPAFAKEHCAKAKAKPCHMIRGQQFHFGPGPSGSTNLVSLSYRGYSPLPSTIETTYTK